MPLTVRSKILIEFLSTISAADVSSTYFILRFQSFKSLLIIIMNRVTPNLVPCGTPPLQYLQLDNVSPTCTACVLLVRNDLIQHVKVWSTFKQFNSSRRMLWSIISKPLLKSARKTLTALFPVSTAS
jgi:hypothetical protein